MRKIILMMSVSLDGFIEGPDRELDWHLTHELARSGTPRHSDAGRRALTSGLLEAGQLVAGEPNLQRR